MCCLCMLINVEEKWRKVRRERREWVREEGNERKGRERWRGVMMEEGKRKRC